MTRRPTGRAAGWLLVASEALEASRSISRREPACATSTEPRTLPRWLVTRLRDPPVKESFGARPPADAPPIALDPAEPPAAEYAEVPADAAPAWLDVMFGVFDVVPGVVETVIDVVVEGVVVVGVVPVVVGVVLVVVVPVVVVSVVVVSVVIVSVVVVPVAFTNIVPDMCIPCT